MLETTITDPSDKSTFNSVNITIEDIENADRKLLIAIYIKYDDPRQWSSIEAFNLLFEKIDYILKNNISSRLIRDLDILSEDEEIISRCHSRLSRGASRCSCGNHSEYTEMVEV